VKNLRGDGLADDLNRLIQEEWRQWCKRGVCTMDGTVAFDELERLLICTAAMDGEFLVLKKVTPANPWGFALQQVDMDQLDHTLFLEKTSTGTEIRMGVEVDQYRRPVAYWLWTRHPNEWSSTYLARKRIPAENVCHAFDPDSANQTRGIPWMAPAMFQMNMLRRYMEAEVTTAPKPTQAKAATPIAPLPCKRSPADSCSSTRAPSRNSIPITPTPRLATS
jgi:lambda family phage portal protein